MKSALINIDVQDFWAKPNPDLNAAIEGFSDRVRPHMPVIWVVKDWVNLRDAFKASALPNASDDVKYNPDYAPSIDFHPDDYVVPVRFQDGFEDSDLKKLLKGLKIENIFIAGYDGPRCVSQTGVRALKEDFNVMLLPDLTSQTSKNLLNLCRYKGMAIMDSHDLNL